MRELLANRKEYRHYRHIVVDLSSGLPKNTNDKYVNYEYNYQYYINRFCLFLMIV